MAQERRMGNLKAVIIGSSSLLLIIIFVLILKTGYSEKSISRSAGDIPHSQPHGAFRNGAEITVGKKYLLGKFDPDLEDDFIEIESKYTKRSGQYLRKETYRAFIKMHEAALQAGIQLTIVSATRSFYQQKNIWEGKWNGKMLVRGKNLAETVSDHAERAKIILKFSSMPGTSRHHWGTDIDLNALENNYFETELGKKIYAWLKENAFVYGFCQPYGPKNFSRPTGYEEEKWHWSYIPLAESFLHQYIRNISYDDLKGFEGWKTAQVLRVIENYVLSINKDCKELSKSQET
ncbi:MAG: M15 family metallopeptidase [Candidatus Aminicenantes bacterium]|jgi:LAS superfamily LD-carboxypeptidase LdcB